MLISKVKVVAALVAASLFATGGGTAHPPRPGGETGGPSGAGRQVELPAQADARPDAAKVGTMWKENFTIEYPGSLPVSVAFSADGNFAPGARSREVIAPDLYPRRCWLATGRPKWMARTPRLALSADQKEGVRDDQRGSGSLLDVAAYGKEVARINVSWNMLSATWLRGDPIKSC